MPEPGPCETKAVPGPALGRGLGAGGAGFWWTGGGWGRGLGGGAQRRAPPGGGGGCQRSAGAGGVAGGDRGDRVSPQNHRKRCSAAFRGHRTLHARALLFSSGWATSCPAQRSGSQIPAENAVLAKKKKKAPHGDTTCSRKTFPLFFSWHGLRQLPERIGANSKKPLCPSPSRHQSRDNSSCESRASLKGPPGIPGGVPSALTTSLPALALRNASPRSVRRPASHPLA